MSKLIRRLCIVAPFIAMAVVIVGLIILANMTLTIPFAVTKTVDTTAGRFDIVCIDGVEYLYRNAGDGSDGGILTPHVKINGWVHECNPDMSVEKVK
jgi:hypothetical protein